MAYGDHLIAHRLFYGHHGIDAGGGRVVHYAPGPWKLDATVAETLFAEFARGDPVTVRAHPGSPFAPAEVVSRARARIGERAYSLTGNNCEHFAESAATGESTSRQVRGFADALLLAGIAIGALALVAVAARR